MICERIVHHLLILEIGFILYNLTMYHQWDYITRDLLQRLINISETHVPPANSKTKKPKQLQKMIEIQRKIQEAFIEGGPYIVIRDIDK